MFTRGNRFGYSLPGAARSANLNCIFSSICACCSRVRAALLDILNKEPWREHVKRTAAQAETAIRTVIDYAEPVVAVGLGAQYFNGSMARSRTRLQAFSQDLVGS